MAITGVCHVESATRSGVASVVVTCQRTEESHSIRRRKWSRIMAIIVACQGVMEPHGIRVGLSVKVRLGCLVERGGWESGSRRSSEGVFLQSKSRVKSGSCRSPDGVFP